MFAVVYQGEVGVVDPAQGESRQREFAAAAALIGHLNKPGKRIIVCGEAHRIVDVVVVVVTTFTFYFLR